MTVYTPGEAPGELSFRLTAGVGFYNKLAQKAGGFTKGIYGGICHYIFLCQYFFSQAGILFRNNLIFHELLKAKESSIISSIPL